MSQKQSLKPIIYFILVAALLASLSSVAFAAPPLQSGGNQGSDSGQNSGNNQGDSGNQGNDNQDDGNNQGDNNQGDGNNQGTGMNQGGAGTNQGAGMNQNNAALACSQSYVVQQGDSLSLIASRFYNDVTAFNTIVQATNASVGTAGSNFTNISDPNLIIPGQTLCIPAAPGSAAANANTGGATGTGANTQGAIPAAASGAGNMGVQPAAATMAGSQQGMLIVENLSGTDLIFDLTQPSLGSAWVGPNQQARFTLQPGQQQFSAHHPAGDFGVAPGTVQITSGQVIWLACSQNMCQMVPSSQLQQGQQQQMGGQQQPSQMPQQQQGQQNDDDNNNDNNDNNGDNNNDNGGDNSNDNGGDNNNDNVKSQ